MITLAVDAMGGDAGLEVTVPGAIAFLQQKTDVRLMMVGDESQVKSALTAAQAPMDRIDIIHASQVVEMDEAPQLALKNKKDSSMRVAINQVKEGQAQAAISAGNTGALMALSMLRLRKLPGVNRPAIACLWPSRNPQGFNVMLDCGADIRADAQDLVQQTFLEAHRSRSSFKGDSELSTWLYGIAKNLVRNYLSRSPHRRFEFCSDALLMEEQDAAPSPMEVLEQGQQLQALTQAMAELSDPVRQLVWMVVVEELSYDEAAAALRIPKGTVRSRLSRARSALRARMPYTMAMI